MSDYSLAINDVQQKHAGIFTITVGSKLKDLYRNLSYTLVVEGNFSYEMGLEVANITEISKQFIEATQERRLLLSVQFTGLQVAALV